MGRAPCCDKANVKRGPWSPDEDAKLKSYIEKHGTGGNWIALPQKIGLKRCGKSCRLRWLNYLRPNIKHGGFTEDEDNLICSLYISIGSRWSIIASQLPGRTDNDIKNYWNTKLKKKLLGKHRREQHAQRETKRGAQNYSIKESCSFSSYNQLPQPVPLVTDIPIMPPLEARFSYDHHPQTNGDGENTGNFCYASYNVSQTQHLCKNSVVSLVPSASTSPQLGTDDFLGICGVQAFDEIPDDIMYHMPQQFDGLNNFSAVDHMVNSSTLGWGDVGGDLLHSSSLSHHHVVQRKASQDWSFFDQPRLLGYSDASMV